MFHLIKSITRISKNTKVSLQERDKAVHLLFVQDALFKLTSTNKGLMNQTNDNALLE